MKSYGVFGLYVLIVALILSGCVTASGESFEELIQGAKTEEASLLVIHELGEMETCMFTVWAFTQPEQRPSPDAVLKWCRGVVINMGEAEYQEVMEYIKEMVEGMHEIDCSGGKCL